jgi:hypothetical protein
VPSPIVAIDPVEQAHRSESQDLQIALQTKNSDALETYLQKYPDSPKRAEVLASISTLRRSEFDEWTQYELVQKQFPWWMQISSIRQFGNRAAVRLKYIADPALPLVAGKKFPDAAYAEQLTVFDCDQPITALSEITIYGKSAEILHHYKWGQPEYLNLSAGASIPPGSVGGTARNIVCHDKLRTPLLGKKRLSAMNFASLSSTAEGDGDIFYVPIDSGAGDGDLRDMIMIFRMHEDVGLKGPDTSVTERLPKYRIEVDRVKLKCSSNESAAIKSEYFDASTKLVYWTATDPSANLQWSKYGDTSPIALLGRIVCPFVGLGVQVAKDGTSIKVVGVIDETPAQKAGVKVNDIITHLDDESVDGMTVNEAVQKMRGPLDTTIKLRITRQGNDSPVELAVTRGVVQRPSVQWPSVQAPAVQWPSVQAPSVQWPSVQGQVKQ